MAVNSDIVLGFSVSLIAGGIVSWLFLKILRWWMRLEKEKLVDEPTRAVPSWLTGGIERLFFTLLIFLKLPGVPAAMLIWLTLKMVTNWNSPFREDRDKKHIRLAFSALLAGLVSLSFAVIGGVIARGPVI